MTSYTNKNYTLKEYSSLNDYPILKKYQTRNIDTLSKYNYYGKPYSKKNTLELNPTELFPKTTSLNFRENDGCIRFLCLYTDPCYDTVDTFPIPKNLDLNYVLKCKNKEEFSNQYLIDYVNSIKNVDNLFFLENIHYLDINLKAQFNIFNDYKYIISSLYYEYRYYICFIKISSYKTFIIYEKERDTLDVEIYLENIKIISYNDINNSRNNKLTLISLIWSNFVDFFQNKQIILNDDRVYDL